LDAILALDHEMLTEPVHTYDLDTFGDRDQLTIGPFVGRRTVVAHFVTQRRVPYHRVRRPRLYRRRRPDPGVVELAHEAGRTHPDDLLDEVSDPSSLGRLSTARDAAWQANAAGARR